MLAYIVGPVITASTRCLIARHWRRYSFMASSPSTAGAFDTSLVSTHYYPPGVPQLTPHKISSLGRLLSTLQVFEALLTCRHTTQQSPYYTGAWPTWLLGNLPEVTALGGPATAHAVFARRYGPLWTSYGGPVPLVMTDHPEYARRVLQARHFFQVGPPVAGSACTAISVLQ